MGQTLRPRGGEEKGAGSMFVLAARRRRQQNAYRAKMQRSM